MISFNLKGQKGDSRPKKEQRPEKSHGSLFEVEKEVSNVKNVSEFAAGELPEKERLRLEEEARKREEKAKAKKIIHLEEKNWRQDLVERREAEMAEEQEDPKLEEGEEWTPQFGLSVFASRGGEAQEERELQALRQDINALPDMASVEDYESMPVEDFGAALFRGMESALPRRVVTEAAKVPEKRPALLGLGAKTLEEHLPEELGTWGKSSRPKPEYTPVVMRNVRTGEIVDEKEIEEGKKREERGDREGSYDSRRDRDSSDSRSSRRERESRDRDSRDSRDRDSRRDRDRERSPKRSSRGDRRDRGDSDRRDRDRRSHRDDRSRRDDDRSSRRDRDRRDRDDRDRDRDRRDRRDRDRDGGRRDRDRDRDRDRRR